jgi:hypothetical protein
MTRLAACIATTLCLAAAPALADSLVSSASSAGSESLGSSSDSSRASSNSSRRDNDDDRRNQTEGDYRVIEVAALAERAGVVRLRLLPAAPGGVADHRGEVWLDVPQRALAPRGLASGDIVSARPRPYGVEFARAETREPFFLLLEDDWYRELAAHAVTATTTAR